MTRIIVHAGFYKTGTTSVQAFLGRNAKLLSPFAAIHLNKDLGAARYLGRLYGQRPVFWRRWMFRRSFRSFMRTVPDAPTIVISRESLSGMMLGFRGTHRRLPHSYAPVAIPLAKEIIRACRLRFGSDAQIEFLYTIRETEPLLRSTWKHVLRSTDLTQDFNTFRASFDKLPNLRDDAEQIATAIFPVPVHVAALEDYSDHPLGPGQALIDLLSLPADIQLQLAPVQPQNAGPSDAQSQQFLTINRSKKRSSTLQRAKQIIATAKGGR